MAAAAARLALPPLPPLAKLKKLYNLVTSAQDSGVRMMTNYLLDEGVAGTAALDGCHL